MEDRRVDRQRTQFPARVTVTLEDRGRKDSENCVHGARLRYNRGLVTALFLFVGVYGLEDESDE